MGVKNSMIIKYDLFKDNQWKETKKKLRTFKTYTV